MKKVMVIAIAAALVCTSNLNAQESSVKATKSRSNIQNNKSCVMKIEPIEEGCAISFDYFLKLSREAGSGLATGKRQHKPMFIVKSSDNSISEAKNPGAISSSRSSNSSKATMKDLSVSMACSRTKLTVVDGEVQLPADCPDGDHDMIVSWSWGVSNSGSSRCVVTFTVTMQDGACHAINTKGTGAAG
jgi:hypothetical protein